MAAQGYAVLQPNFRGSILNSNFLQAGFGEWGRKMQSDLSDGVRYLAHQGIIDPKRVCIVGASYGGYAALAGVTVESGVYRCAVSVAGISDLRRFRKWTSRQPAGLVAALLGPIYGDGRSERSSADRDFTDRACRRRKQFRFC